MINFTHFAHSCIQNISRSWDFATCIDMHSVHSTQSGKVKHLVYHSIGMRWGENLSTTLTVRTNWNGLILFSIKKFMCSQDQHPLNLSGAVTAGRKLLWRIYWSSPNWSKTFVRLSPQVLMIYTGMWPEFTQTYKYCSIPMLWLGWDLLSVVSYSSRECPAYVQHTMIKQVLGSQIMCKCL